jgi:hypothetical protein
LYNEIACCYGTPSLCRDYFLSAPNPGAKNNPESPVLSWGKQPSEIVKQSQTHYPKYTRGICLGYRQDIPYIDFKGVYYRFTTEKVPMMAKVMEFRVHSKVVRM